VTEETQATNPDDFGVSIDPASWEDPKETFPGVVEVSEKRWASDKYKESKTFWEGFDPATPIPQWDLRVRRLDAVLVLPDGTQAPAVRYGTIDLKKWSNRDRKLVPLSSAYKKEWLIVNEWKRIFGKVEPPEVIVGKIAMFDFFRSKALPGSSMPATNVLLPVTVLPPDYTFDGEVRLFQVRERADDSTSETADESGVKEAAVITTIDPNAILPFINGKNRKDATGIITSLPEELRQPTLLSQIATGALFEQLASDKKIEIAPDGTISLV